jgi:peptidoglycan/LPS O-acetylase OafA/YrhL
LEGRRRFATAAAAASLVAIAFICLYPSRDPALPHFSRSFDIFYLATFRTCFSAAAAYLLLFSASAHRAGRAVGGFLGRRFWYPIAQLSYSVYLLHPIVIITAFSVVSPENLPARQALLFYGLVDLGLSLLAATLLYLLIERPFMNLRPAAEPRSTSR